MSRSLIACLTFAFLVHLNSQAGLLPQSADQIKLELIAEQELDWITALFKSSTLGDLMQAGEQFSRLELLTAVGKESDSLTDLQFQEIVLNVRSELAALHFVEELYYGMRISSALPSAAARDIEKSKDIQKLLLLIEGEETRLRKAIDKRKDLDSRGAQLIADLEAKIRRADLKTVRGRLTARSDGETINNLRIEIERSKTLIPKYEADLSYTVFQKDTITEIMSTLADTANFNPMLLVEVGKKINLKDPVNGLVYLKRFLQSSDEDQKQYREDQRNRLAEYLIQNADIEDAHLLSPPDVRTAWINWIDVQLGLAQLKEGVLLETPFPRPPVEQKPNKRKRKKKKKPALVSPVVDAAAQQESSGLTEPGLVDLPPEPSIKREDLAKEVQEEQYEDEYEEEEEEVPFEIIQTYQQEHLNWKSLKYKKKVDAQQAEVTESQSTPWQVDCDPKWFLNLKENLQENLKNLCSDLAQQGPRPKNVAKPWPSMGFLKGGKRDPNRGFGHCHLDGSGHIQVYWTSSNLDKTIQIFKITSKHVDTKRVIKDFKASAAEKLEAVF